MFGSQPFAAEWNYGGSYEHDNEVCGNDDIDTMAFSENDLALGYEALNLEDDSVGVIKNLI